MDELFKKIEDEIKSKIKSKETHKLRENIGILNKILSLQNMLSESPTNLTNKFETELTLLLTRNELESRG